jgi:hypothetical protein
VTAYLVTTGLIFALIVLAHIMRFIDEGPGIAGDPVYWATTALAAAMCLWAVRLLLRYRRGGPAR